MIVALIYISSKVFEGVDRVMCSPCSADSHEISGDDPATTEQESDNESSVSMETSDKTMETEDKQASDAMETDDKPSNGGQEYNPLIVRRSNRAIKPTKDVDLYLLGAQFGIDVEGSDVDSSDPEFALEGDKGQCLCVRV